jgi:uncharacterized tellurite resistance protein B-like protein
VFFWIDLRPINRNNRNTIMKNFTARHALLAMFFEMANADGQVEKSEMQKIGELSRKYITAQNSDFDEVIS